jgi:hypothetical protein
VRLKIYGFILDPFYQYCEKTQSRCIEVLFQASSPSSNIRKEYVYGGDFSKYIAAELQPIGGYLFQPQWLLEHEKVQRAREIFEKEKMHYLRQKAPHPRRLSNYRLQAFPLLVQSEDAQKIKDWTMIRLLQQLLNLNCQLRREISSVFWENVNLNCQEFEDLTELKYFLERPATYCAIKTLSVKFSWDFALHSVCKETAEKNLWKCFKRY